MNNEEKKLLKIFIKKCQRYDETVEVKGVSLGEEARILDTVIKALNLIEKQQKEIEDKKEEAIAISKSSYMCGMLAERSEWYKKIRNKIKYSKAIDDDVAVVILEKLLEEK